MDVHDPDRLIHPHHLVHPRRPLPALIQHVLVVVEEVGQEGEAEVVEEEAEVLEVEGEDRAEGPQIQNVLPRVVHALMKRQANVCSFFHFCTDILAPFRLVLLQRPSGRVSAQASQTASSAATPHSTRRHARIRAGAVFWRRDEINGQC